MDEPPIRSARRRHRAERAGFGGVFWTIVGGSVVSLTILTCVVLYMVNRTPAKKPQPASHPEQRDKGRH
jgi:hypothetical protein